MAARLPPLSDVAPSPALETSPLSSRSAIQPPPTAHATATTMTDSELVKLEDPSTPLAMTSTSAETTVSTPCYNDNDGNAGSATTTAAGRKRKLNSNSARGVANLTPEQLAKKRANDRQAQRAIRERTKSHIESLEQRVRELSSQKPFLDLQAALKQNEAIQAENKELRRGLKAVMDIIQPLVGKQEALNIQAAAPGGAKPTNSLMPSTSPFMDNHALPVTAQRSATAEHSYTESIASVETPSSTHSAPTLGSRRDSTGPINASLRVAFDYQRHHLSHGLDFGGDERMGFNFLLDPSQQVPRMGGFRRRSSELCRTQPSVSPGYNNILPPLGSITDQPLPAYMTPIRNTAATCTLDAILLDFLHNRQREAARGVSKQKLVGPAYPSVSSLLNPEKSVYSHPLSKVFTDILRTFPDISSLPEQVAVLYAMFLLMRWQIFPTSENYDRLPDWLIPLPSQLVHPHPAWMDYLPWPQMRERLVMSYAEYPFENWFIPFTNSLSVNWPYDATDCLLSTGDSEDLIINPVFERHFADLNNWSLGPAFAEAYPHLIETTRIKP